MKKFTAESFKKDVYYPKVCEAMRKILASANFVAPIQVFLHLGYIDQAQIDEWRKGGIPYLEKAIRCNLSKISRILRLTSLQAQEMKLKPSFTVYQRKTKGPKTDLRFSKTGDPNLEKAYATSFVSVYKAEAKAAKPADAAPLAPPAAAPASAPSTA